jgi:hypothetical protein
MYALSQSHVTSSNPKMPTQPMYMPKLRANDQVILQQLHRHRYHGDPAKRCNVNKPNNEPHHVQKPGAHYITMHSRSGWFLSLCLPFSKAAPGSLLLLLFLSFFSFLLLLREIPKSFFSLTGEGPGWPFSALFTLSTTMTGSSVLGGSVVTNLSLLPRPVSLDNVRDNRVSPLGLPERLLLPPNIREPRRDAVRKLVF